MKDSKKLISYFELWSLTKKYLPKTIAINFIKQEFSLSIEDILAHPSKKISFHKGNCLSKIKKIAHGYPWQYLYNVCYFKNKALYIEQSVLIPRPETELLVNIANKKIKKNFHVLEVGTGTGVIPNFLQEKKINYLGLDINKRAIKCSRINNPDKKFINCKIEKFLKTNHSKFDIIIANPPYIDKKSSAYIFNKYESKKALFAKNSGLYFFELLLKNFHNIIAKDGLCILEIGYDQKASITKICNEYGLKYFFEKDNFKQDRCVVIKAKNEKV